MKLNRYPLRIHLNFKYQWKYQFTLILLAFVALLSLFTHALMSQVANPLLKYIRNHHTQQIHQLIVPVSSIILWWIPVMIIVNLAHTRCNVLGLLKTKTKKMIYPRGGTTLGLSITITRIYCTLKPNHSVAIEDCEVQIFPPVLPNLKMSLLPH